MHEIGVAVMAVKVVAFVGVMVFSLAAAGVWLGVWQARSAASISEVFQPPTRRPLVLLAREPSA